MASQPVPFHAKWDAVPLAFIDFETTGVVPGVDQAVEVGIARFEGGRYVAGCGSRLNPGCPIPEAAQAVHGITDADVADMPTLDEYLATALPKALLSNAQPGGYNGSFDRWFMPPSALAQWAWPWLDAMQLVAVVDKFAKGPGRHKLAASCARHGVKLDKAHSAEADARAAGELFHVLLPKVFKGQPPTIGDLLYWTRSQEAKRWADFHDWLGRQPAK
jgi:DNA polymerase III epsilon subunit-like protein